MTHYTPWAKYAHIYAFPSFYYFLILNIRKKNYSVLFDYCILGHIFYQEMKNKQLQKQNKNSTVEEHFLVIQVCA